MKDFAAYHAFSAVVYYKPKNAINGLEPLNTALNAAELYFMTPPPQAVPLPFQGRHERGKRNAGFGGYQSFSAAAPKITPGAINGLEAVKDFGAKTELYNDVCDGFCREGFRRVSAVQRIRLSCTKKSGRRLTIS